MIRYAAKMDHPRLKDLWQEVFGDPKEAVDAYFALRHRDENMLVEAVEDTIAGMLTMLPVTLASCQRDFPARYVYAVATAPAFRNRGISSRLMDRAHLEMQKKGEAAAILVPATPSLFAFYGKRGYQTAFALDILRLPAASLPPFPGNGLVEPCSPGDYARLRDAAFSGSRLYARWNISDIRYAMETFGEAGGVTKLSDGHGEGCAAWERQGESVLIRELALAGMDVNTAVSLLNRQLGASEYTLRLMEGGFPGAETRPFGMIRWLIAEPELTGAPPYLSLALD